METRGINILEEKLKEYQWGDAIISISHKLYGEQKLKIKFDYICDKDRVGFRTTSGHDIFVYKRDLVDYGTKDGIYFADDLMKIEIKIA